MNWPQVNWLSLLDSFVGVAAGASVIWMPLLIKRANLSDRMFLTAMVLWITLIVLARFVSYASGVYEGIQIQQRIETERDRVVAQQARIALHRGAFSRRGGRE